MPRKRATPEERHHRAIDRMDAILVLWQQDLLVPDKLKLSPEECRIVRGALAKRRETA